MTTPKRPPSDDAQPKTPPAPVEPAAEDPRKRVNQPVEDESADPVGDGHSDAQAAERLPPV